MKGVQWIMVNLRRILRKYKDDNDLRSHTLMYAQKRTKDQVKNAESKKHKTKG